MRRVFGTIRHTEHRDRVARRRGSPRAFTHPHRARAAAGLKHSRFFAWLDRARTRATLKRRAAATAQHGAPFIQSVFGCGQVCLCARRALVFSEFNFFKLAESR